MILTVTRHASNTCGAKRATLNFQTGANGSCYQQLGFGNQRYLWLKVAEPVRESSVENAVGSSQVFPHF